MVEVAVRARNQQPDVTHLFMCYWAAFNNIYVTIAERTGRRARLLKNPDGSIKTRQTGHVDIPQVSTVPEREQHTLVFQRFTDHLKQGLVEHNSTRFFAERTPSWRGCPIELDITGRRLNGVLNVGYTVDANHPVWAPIDVVEFAAYFDQGKTHCAETSLRGRFSTCSTQFATIRFMAASVSTMRTTWRCWPRRYPSLQWSSNHLSGSSGQPNLGLQQSVAYGIVWWRRG